MVRSLLPTVLALLLACGREDSTRTEARREQALEKSPLPPVPPANPLSPYESTGRLAPAPQPVLGVVVPRVGHVLSMTDEIATLVVPAVPFDATLRFFQARLDTGRIETAGQGTRILGAHPRAPGNARRRVDVILRSTARGTVVSIFDKTPSGRPAPQGDEAVRQALRAPIADR